MQAKSIPGNSTWGPRSISEAKAALGPSRESYAIEVNLRKGWTAQPFLTLQFLADGAYDPYKAVSVTRSGREKHFVATDHLVSPAYRALSSDDPFDIALRHGLHFSQSLFMASY